MKNPFRKPETVRGMYDRVGTLYTVGNIFLGMAGYNLTSGNVAEAIMAGGVTLTTYAFAVKYDEFVKATLSVADEDFFKENSALQTMKKAKAEKEMFY